MVAGTEDSSGALTEVGRCVQPPGDPGAAVDALGGDDGREFEVGGQALEREVRACNTLASQGSGH